MAMVEANEEAVEMKGDITIMDSTYRDGHHELKDNPKMSDFFKRLEDDDVEAVALHKPGSIVTHKDGTRYLVTKDGSWRKLGARAQDDGSES